MKDHVSWEVKHRIAPYYWRIEGVSDNGIRTTINYTLAETSEGIRYEREFCYWRLGSVLSLWDSLYARKRLWRYSEQALQNLKQKFAPIPAERSIDPPAVLQPS